MFTGLESPWHLLVVLVVALIVFGPKRLPDIGRSLGGGIRSFKDSLEGKHEEVPTERVVAAQPPTTDAQPAAITGQAKPDGR